MVGNLVADLNGMAGGARSTGDGEHAIAPIFRGRWRISAERISTEEEVPFIHSRQQEADEGPPVVRQANRGGHAGITR